MLATIVTYELVLLQFEVPVKQKKSQIHAHLNILRTTLQPATSLKLKVLMFWFC